MNLFELKYQMLSQKLKDEKLLPDQEKAFKYIAGGENIFLTGCGGTGKSFIIKLFKKIYNHQRIIAVTSTTGTSALLINGTTLHSYLGIGLGKGSVSDLISLIMKKTYIRKRWNDLDTLIIDEISMLSPELFDKLEEIARKIRRNQKPFGGIQLILTGDFLQLPVINSDKFCFEAKSWESCVDHTVYLTQIVRQTNTEFQKCLNNVRIGNLNAETRKILSSRVGIELKNDFGIIPTQLYSTNDAVDEINEEEMDKLADGDPDFYEYKMEIHMYNNSKNKEFLATKIKKYCQASDEIQLCIGAQVILLINLDLENQLANGSRGVIIGFIQDKPVVQFLNGKERIIDHHVWEIEENDQKVMKIIQIPLKLAFAISCHRSQGTSLDYAIIDLGNIFEYGMAYVALSRVTSLEGLSIVRINFEKIRASPKAMEFYEKLEAAKLLD
jgi:ATP-dependent DNA helicase PIF1